MNGNPQDPVFAFPRTMTITAERLFRQFPVLAIVGPRQSGKTTLARTLFARLPYVNLENPEERRWALDDPVGFLDRFPAGAVLDEVQRVPDLFSWIQVQVDRHMGPGQFVLTGSHQFLLVEAISQSLAGRVATLRLLPLSLAEWPATDVPWEERLVRGSFPGPVLRDISPADWMPNYIQTYLERDVRLVRDIPDLSLFHRFLQLCAGRTGQVLNLSALAGDAGISHTTARAWLSVLEASLLVHLLPPYHANFGKRLTKSPKMHLLDSGLTCHLLGIHTVDHLRHHPLRGAIFESWVVSETIKHHWNHGRQAALFHWRDQHGHEVDLVLESADGLHAIEAKSGQTTSPDDATAMRWWRALAPPGRNAVVHGGTLAQQSGDTAWVPWRTWTDWLA